MIIYWCRKSGADKGMYRNSAAPPHSQLNPKERQNLPAAKLMSRLPQMQKQEKNPDEILQEKAGFEDDLRIELPDDSEGERQSISVETDALT